MARPRRHLGRHHAASSGHDTTARSGRVETPIESGRVGPRRAESGLVEPSRAESDRVGSGMERRRAAPVVGTRPWCDSRNGSAPREPSSTGSPRLWRWLRRLRRAQHSTGRTAERRGGTPDSTAPHWVATRHQTRLSRAHTTADRTAAAPGRTEPE